MMDLKASMFMDLCVTVSRHKDLEITHKSRKKVLLKDRDLDILIGRTSRMLGVVNILSFDKGLIKSKWVVLQFSKNYRNVKIK